MTEIWSPIKKYPGYEVSTYGRFRSLDRVVVDKNGVNKRYKGKIIKTHLIKGTGYLMVHFGLSKEKRNKSAHRIVAKTFIENPLKLKQVNHKDLDKTNNRVENLEWASYKSNRDHARMMGVKFGRPSHRGWRK